MLRRLGPPALATCTTFTALTLLNAVPSGTGAGTGSADPAGPSRARHTLAAGPAAAGAPAGLPAVVPAVVPAAATVAVNRRAPAAAAAGGFPAHGAADVAHRGGAAYAPENTLAAFRQARARHADAFELDVRETRDHQLVIMHDATLARTTDAEQVFPRRSPWRVEDFTLAEIKHLDAGAWFDRRYRGERVPTLAETLRAMEGGGLGLLLEVKSPAHYPGIGRRVRARLRASPGWLRPGRLIVQSFDSRFVRSFHRLMPAVPTAVLGTPARGRLAATSRYADFVNPRHGDVTRGYVTAVHRSGMRLFAWTVDDAATMRRMLAAGADGVITNRPDTLRRVLDG